VVSAKNAACERQDYEEANRLLELDEAIKVSIEAGGSGVRLLEVKQLIADADKGLLLKWRKYETVCKAKEQYKEAEKAKKCGKALKCLLDRARALVAPNKFSSGLDLTSIDLLTVKRVPPAFGSAASRGSGFGGSASGGDKTLRSLVDLVKCAKQRVHPLADSMQNWPDPSGGSVRAAVMLAQGLALRLKEARLTAVHFRQAHFTTDQLIECKKVG